MPDAVDQLLELLIIENRVSNQVRWVSNSNFIIIDGKGFAATDSIHIIQLQGVVDNDISDIEIIGITTADVTLSLDPQNCFILTKASSDRSGIYLTGYFPDDGIGTHTCSILGSTEIKALSIPEIGITVQKPSAVVTDDYEFDLNKYFYWGAQYHRNPDTVSEHYTAAAAGEKFYILLRVVDENGETVKGDVSSQAFVLFNSEVIGVGTSAKGILHIPVTIFRPTAIGEAAKISISEVFYEGFNGQKTNLDISEVNLPTLDVIIIPRYLLVEGEFDSSYHPVVIPDERIPPYNVISIQEEPHVSWVTGYPFSLRITAIDFIGNVLQSSLSVVHFPNDGVPCLSSSISGMCESPSWIFDDISVGKSLPVMSSPNFYINLNNGTALINKVVYTGEREGSVAYSFTSQSPYGDLSNFGRFEMKKPFSLVMTDSPIQKVSVNSAVNATICRSLGVCELPSPWIQHKGKYIIAPYEIFSLQFAVLDQKGKLVSGDHRTKVSLSATCSDAESTIRTFDVGHSTRRYQITKPLEWNIAIAVGGNIFLENLSFLGRYVFFND